MRPGFAYPCTVPPPRHGATLANPPKPAGSSWTLIPVLPRSRQPLHSVPLRFTALHSASLSVTPLLFTLPTTKPACLFQRLLSPSSRRRRSRGRYRRVRRRHRARLPLNPVAHTACRTPRLPLPSPQSHTQTQPRRLPPDVCLRRLHRPGRLGTTGLTNVTVPVVLGSGALERRRGLV